MYALKKSSYSFNPATKQITFFMPEFSPEKVRAITDMTKKIVLYAPQVGIVGGSFNNNVLTLDLDTTTGGYASTDVLEILYDVEYFYNKVFKTSFTDVIASGVDSKFWTLLATGSGQTVSQSAGNLVLASGTTINSETIIRSKIPFFGNFLMRSQVVLSQRIVNNNFSIELVDVIGDGLAFTINSATSVTVTIPNTTFTSANVGQSMNIGNLTGTAGTIPMVAVIASVTGTAVTFTVAGWPASGSGTCSLFGWNEYSITYNTATATNNFILNRRNGWALTATTATINTTASPGHQNLLAVNTDQMSYADQLIASGAIYQPTVRASAVVNLPDQDIPMYIQIRSKNGTTAPASTTTWTIGMLALEQYDSMPVIIEGSKFGGANTSIMAQIMNAVAISGTVTVSGTVTANTTETTLITPTAHTLAHLATTNATSVKATAGTIYAIVVSNTHSAVQFLKIYNKASAPTVGTDVPVLTIPVPVGGVVPLEFGRVGLRLGTGIAIASTLLGTDADTTAVVVSTLKSTISYI